MLAEFRGTATGIARRFAQAYRHTHQLSFARYRMVIIDDILISLYLRVVRQVVDRIDHGVDEISTFIEDLHPFGTSLRKKYPVENVDQLAAVLASQLHRVKARVINQFPDSKGITEIFPVFVLDHAQTEPLLVSALIMVP